MKKQDGFLFPILVVGLIGLSSVALYQQRTFDRTENDKRAVFIAKNVTDTLNYVQEYQLWKSKESTGTEPEDQFPSSLEQLAEMGTVPNCVESPTPEQAATNCNSVTKSAFGGDMVLITDPENSKRKLLKIDISNFNFGGYLSQSSVRTNKTMTAAEKRDWALVKRVSSMIVRSEIVVEGDKTWLQVPIDMASAYTTTAPDGYLKLDGTVELEADWNAGDHRIIAGNGNIQLTDGTKLGGDTLILAAGVRSVDTGTTEYNGVVERDVTHIRLEMCKKANGSKPSVGNPIKIEDINVSAFISSIYPLIDTTFGESRKEIEALHNQFANIGTFGVTSLLRINPNNDIATVHFNLINYGQDSYGQNGFWGGTNENLNFNPMSYEPSLVLPHKSLSDGASETPIGAHISYIVSCKRV